MKYLHLILLFAFLVLLACGHENTAGGNSTETENAIALRIVDSQGNLMARVSYRVLPLWYVGDTIQRLEEKDYTYSGESDSEGWIRIENHQDGKFLIEVSNDSLSGILQYFVQSNSVQNVTQEMTIKKSGVVEGKVELPEKTPFAWILIYGMDRVVRTDSAGRFVIENLPAGNLTLIAVSDNSTIGQESFEVVSGDTVRLDSIGMPKYSRAMKGGELVSDWMKPLSPKSVFILRLDSANMNFSELKADGSDLRLLNASGEPLPMRVAYWDSANSHGVVQIKIEDWSDTQGEWIMKWGNPFAKPLPEIDVWDGLSDSLVLALNSVQVADFENNSSQTSLPSPIEPMYWYKSASEGASINPTKEGHFADALQPADSGRTGKAAHFEYSAPDSGYALIATNLSSGVRSLAQMDSLELWIRGDGEYSIALENLVDSDDWKAVYNGVNTSSWSRVVIRPQDFAPADSAGGNYGWNFIKHQISTLTIFARKGSGIWLDDIRIYGINRDDLK